MKLLAQWVSDSTAVPFCHRIMVICEFDILVTALAMRQSGRHIERLPDYRQREDYFPISIGDL